MINNQIKRCTKKKTERYDQRSEQNKSRAKIKILIKTCKTHDLCRLLKKVDLITQNRFKIDNRHKLIRSTAVDLEESSICRLTTNKTT